MIDTGTLIGTAVAGHKWIIVWHEKQANPPTCP
jgi:hypothetical protein